MVQVELFLERVRNITTSVSTFVAQQFPERTAQMQSIQGLAMGAFSTLWNSISN